MTCLPDVAICYEVQEPPGPKTYQYVCKFAHPNWFVGPLRRGLEEKWWPSATLAACSHKDRILKLTEGVTRLITIDKNTTNNCARVRFGTAFFVAPNILVTARHTTAPEPNFEHLGHLIIPERGNCSTREVEAMMDKSDYPLDKSPLSDACVQKLMSWGAYVVTPLNDGPTTTKLGPNLFIDPEMPSETLPWKWEQDFLFLHSTSLSSSEWFLPFYRRPADNEDVAYLGFSHTPKGPNWQDLIAESYGADPEELHDIFGENRMFLSPGNIIGAGCNAVSFAHNANTKKAACGGPILPLETQDLAFPALFYGLHVGPFSCISAWNSSISVNHPEFMVAWRDHAFPRVKHLLASLNPSKRAITKEYLGRIRAVVHETETKDQIQMASEAL
eukprot:Phypoly_transcript_08169.p1 GENE.Phypoly_transcript_08169~~Phypoly_transcript_08169.p1  ORF type:complete len:388 (+),score=42.89 Phypoly_transcript_08169:168-1331(+)